MLEGVKGAVFTSDKKAAHAMHGGWLYWLCGRNRTRTCDLLLVREALWPTELPARLHK